MENRRAFGTQLFPFRTIAMLLSLITIPLISQLMVWLFKSNRLKKSQDIFLCIVNIPEEEDQVTLALKYKIKRKPESILGGRSSKF